MNKLYFLLFFFCATMVNAQLADWSTAPDFSLPDLDDDYHELYDYLDDGYSVILDFSATWCGPCWSYHQTGVLEDLYDEYGPGGEDKVMVFMIEADPATSQQCIYGSSGCSGGSIGDWTDGVTYPILNPPAAEAATVNSDFNINYYPTLYGVAPNGDIYEVGQAGFDVWESWVAESFQMHNTTWEQNEEDCTSSFIDLHVEGGYGQVQYEWSNGSVSEDLVNIPPGDYYVTLTDDHDYEVVIGPIEIEFNNGAALNLLDVGDVFCNGAADGFIEVELTDGSGDYEYEWSNGATTPMIEDLFAGEYEVVAIDVNTGCEFEMEIEIEEPEELEYDYELYQPECGESDMGAVEYEVDGGTWPLTFLYDDIDTRSDYIELEPGEYSITIMDANGCELVTESFEIIAPDAPEAYSSVNGLINCVTDSVAIAIDSSSAGPNISYAWFDPMMNYIGSDSSTTIGFGGSYTLQVTNTTSGCVTSSSVMVYENFEEPMADAQSSNDIDCINSTSLLTATGVDAADSSIVIVWSTLDGSILSDPSLAEVEVSAAGQYDLMITNTLSGCYSTSSVSIESFDVPELEVYGETSFCEGSVTTLCADINNNESVSWYRNGELMASGECLDVDVSSELEVVLMDDNTGCSATQFVETFELALPEVGLPDMAEFCNNTTGMVCLDQLGIDESVVWTREDGTVAGTEICYEFNAAMSLTATVTNMVTNCVNSDEVMLVELPEPVAEVSGDLQFCDGEFTTLCVDNSMDGQVAWKINGMELSTEACFTLDYATDIEIEFTDNSTGCSSSTMLVTQTNDIPYAEINSDGLLDCVNGEVELSLDGDLLDIQVAWYDYNNNIIGNDPQVTVVEQGSYTAELTSSNGCQYETSFMVDFDPEELAHADFDYDNSDFDFQFNNLTEGSYNTVEWNFGDGNTSSEENPSHTYSEAGFYTVQLTITNDCGSTTFTVDLAAYTDLQLTTVTTDVSCYGSDDGRISVNTFGGIPPYSYDWMDQNIAFDVSELEGLTAGEYSVVVTDAVGQVVDQTITITEAEAMVLTASASYDKENMSGDVVLDVQGGNGDYTYEWSDGSTEQNLSGVPVGTYTVVVTDALGCTETITVIVEDTTSVFELDILNAFEVYPNPTTEKAFVRIELAESVNSRLTVYSLLGEVVLQEQFNNNNNIAMDLNVNNWNAGLYMVELQAESKVVVRKLLVSK